MMALSLNGAAAAFAVLLTLGGLGCHLALPRRSRHDGAGIFASVVAGVSTLDMVCPGVSLLPPLLWAPGLLLVGLVLLLSRGSRVDIALDSAGLILMGALWLMPVGHAATHPGSVSSAPQGHHAAALVDPALAVAVLCILFLAATIAVCVRTGTSGHPRRWGQAMMAGSMVAMAVAMAS
ncbi:hypothetical protein [Cryobacterium zhongshanensis]|uniref:Uncharacterized protein n=1 Tax=Cryobacterium zhongshanensis TaxID=2928153 RepID=A0AA41UH15_9MICO|nr:hypothetical protein [Cryobacterium zhongshanensis]MCI4657894.1 hypothetical protein [Cryobacterium zhongshanensis]